MKKTFLIIFCFLQTNHAGLETLLQHINSDTLLEILTDKDIGRKLKEALNAQTAFQKKIILQNHFKSPELEAISPILPDICEVIDTDGIEAVKKYHNKVHEAHQKILDNVSKASIRVAGRKAHLNIRATI